jgi:hypothetical protein
MRPALVVLALALLGCPKQIGDSCSLSSDCSINADRICDLAQPGGYCTVPGCEANGCPSEAMCISFDAHAPRLRRRYCMLGCNGNADCRDGYRCVPPDPVACLQSPTAILPTGQSCNRIADTSPTHAGWCVRAQ